MDEAHLERRDLSPGEVAISMDQEGGDELHLLLVVEIRPVCRGQVHDHFVIAGGKFQTGHFAKHPDVPSEIGEGVTERTRGQPEISEHIGIADIDPGREVKAVAIVGKLTRGDLNQTGLGEPRDTAIFAIDGAQGETRLL